MSKTALLHSLCIHICILLGLLLTLHSFHFLGLSKPQQSLTAYLNTNTHHATQASIKTQRNHTQYIPKQNIPSIPSTKPQNTPSNAKHLPNTPTLATSIKEPAPAQIQPLLQLIAEHIQQHLQYPNLAITHIQQGQSLLQFQLTPQGSLQDIKIIQSSGNPSLDQAATKAVIDSSPIHIPNTLQISNPLILRLPVHFSIQ